MFDSVTPASHKTRDFAQSVESLDGVKKVLVVDGRAAVNPVLQLASGNLPNVHLLPWQVRERNGAKAGTPGQLVTTPLGDNPSRFLVRSLPVVEANVDPLGLRPRALARVGWEFIFSVIPS